MSKRLKSIISAALAVAMIAGSVPAYAASVENFTDAADHWAKANLGRAIDDGVLFGNGTKLDPDGTLNGGAMVSIMVRQLGLQSWTKDYPGAEKGQWYSKQAAIAYSHGLLPSDASVPMTENVTRSQVFDIIAAGFFGYDKASDPEASEKQPAADETATETTETETATDESATKTDETATSTEESAAAQQPADEKSTESATDAAITESTTEPAVTQPVIVPEPEKQPITGAAKILFDAGVIQGDEYGNINADKPVTRAEFITMLYRALAVAPTAVREESEVLISISADDVAAGGSIKAKASISSQLGQTDCSLQWYCEGTATAGYYMSGKTIENGTSFDYGYSLKFTRNMSTGYAVGLFVSYIDPATGGNINLYKEKLVGVSNYSTSYYDEKDRQARLLANGVSCVYTGNYTSASTANLDYSTAVKESFVNSKGYTSKTEYLVWGNLATQKVNIFKGSAGNWKLIKTFRCASGAKSTPTPIGVTYVTYKQSGWKTDTYVVKPVVRFYPGTGYAFHSILYTPDGSKVKDGSMGFPRSHGCLRMMPEGIQYIYDNIPVNTTVVIY